MWIYELEIKSIQISIEFDRIQTAHDLQHNNAKNVANCQRTMN